MDMDIEEEEEEQEEESSNGEKEVSVPLSEVVSDCVKRWFNDTLKEAKSGDVNMQVLVAQMYYNGYGVTRDPNKVFALFFFHFSFFPSCLPFFMPDFNVLVLTVRIWLVWGRERKKYRKGRVGD